MVVDIETSRPTADMAELIRTHDWASTSLGSMAEWPSCLRVTVDLVLPSKAQIVIFWGPEFLALYNDAYAPTIGDKHPRALGRPARESWSELWDDLEPLLLRVFERGETMYAKDRPFYIERRGYPEDVFFDISYSPVRDEAGLVRGVFCIVNETTERVLAQRELTKTQERLSYALDASGMLGTFDWHIKSDTFYSDDRFAAMFSVDPDKGEKGAPIAEYMVGIHPEDRERVGAAVDHTIATGAKYVQEYRLLHRDGQIRWIEARGECLYDDQGQPERFPGVVIEITERKQAEEMLLRLAAIVASSDDAIMSIDLDARITSWNEGAERLYGFSAEEVIGQPVSIILPADRSQEEHAILARIRRGERVDPYDTQRLHKNRTNVDVSLTVSPVRDAAGKVVGASKIARDIRARKEAERLQRVLMNELKHRVKNVLATVRAIAMQTFRDEEHRLARAAFDARLLALARAHDLLTAESWSGAELSALIAEVLSPYDRGNFEIGGPRLRLPSEVVLPFSLALHELATNAAKYGALSVPSGQVSIRWSIMDDDSPRLSLSWTERGGPAVHIPSHKGFGSRLVEGLLSVQLGGEVRIDYAAKGLVCEIDAPLRDGWITPIRERTDAPGQVDASQSA
ncbi:PAS domain-containing sensor histidine kinase [Arvimicrobium flavum]|uniref:PAS domain-containing sensor histidine kinase n=1 Tax=Arvimicrobium flavum TaxID=3393320 RepID=UPI0030843483